MFAGTALATHQQTRPGLCPRAAAAPARALPPSPRRVSSQIAVINRSIKSWTGPKHPPSESVGTVRGPCAESLISRQRSGGCSGVVGCPSRRGLGARGAWRAPIRRALQRRAGRRRRPRWGRRRRRRRRRRQPRAKTRPRLPILWLRRQTAARTTRRRRGARTRPRTRMPPHQQVFVRGPALHGIALCAHRLRLVSKLTQLSFRAPRCSADGIRRVGPCRACR